MKHRAKILGVISLAMSVFSASAQSQHLDEQQEFAKKIGELLIDKQYDYAKAVTDKYLELVPNAAPVKRELAAYYMSTTALYIEDDLIDFDYPDGGGQKIIDLLNEVIETTPDDAKALSYLVAMHAYEGNIELGRQTLDKANKLKSKHKSLAYHSALLAILDDRVSDAVRLLSTLGVGQYGRSNNSYYSFAWRLQRKIAITQPEYDTVPAVRDGLATRVLMNDLPEYYLDYDPNGPPILLLFSSQDRSCEVCAAEMRAFNEFALQNKQAGSPYQIVYASAEPWRDFYNYSSFLTGMNIGTVPTYLVTNKGEHIAKWAGSKSVSSVKLLDMQDHIMANGNMSVDVAPRSVYLLDYMHSKFKKYAKLYNGSASAMAYAINEGQSRYDTTVDQDNQATAETLVLNNCQNAVDKWDDRIDCKLYAKGDTIVDTVALRHNKARELARKRITRQFAKQKSKRILKNKADKKSASKSDSKKIPTKARNKTPSAKTVSPAIAISRAETIRQFTQIKEHYKALAFAQENEIFITGMASKEITQARANKVAIDKCNAALSVTDVGADCLLHTIGKSEVTNQSEEHILKLTSKQQKKNAKNSVFGASYKKYKKLSGDKAYAISMDDSGQWANGMAFGQRGEDKATQAALSNCEANRLSKNLPNECRVLILNTKFVAQPK